MSSSQRLLFAVISILLWIGLAVFTAAANATAKSNPDLSFRCEKQAIAMRTILDDGLDLLSASEVRRLTAIAAVLIALVAGNVALLTIRVVEVLA